MLFQPAFNGRVLSCFRFIRTYILYDAYLKGKNFLCSRYTKIKPKNLRLSKKYIGCGAMVQYLHLEMFIFHEWFIVYCFIVLLKNIFLCDQVMNILIVGRIHEGCLVQLLHSTGFTYAAVLKWGTKERLLWRKSASILPFEENSDSRRKAVEEQEQGQTCVCGLLLLQVEEVLKVVHEHLNVIMLLFAAWTFSQP
jgi:hypothetical protein